ncbi:MAG: hypothetical protein ACKOXV_06635 [Bacteroidota bacterium]|jgi:hypothetical protein
MITPRAIFAETVDDFIKSIINEKSKEIIYRATHDFGVIDVIYRDYKDIDLFADIVSDVDGKTEIVFSMPVKNVGASIHPLYVARTVYEYLAECYKMAQTLSNVRVQNNPDHKD